MENNNNQLVLKFQSCCEFYFENEFQRNRFLYFDKIPHNYFGTDYKVEIIQANFQWLDKPALSIVKHLNNDRDKGKSKLKFQQHSSVQYSFRINSLMEVPMHTEVLKFYADSFEPYTEAISATLIVEDLIIFDKFRDIKSKIKSSFKIASIDEAKYDNDTIGFGFFADILRKGRTTLPKNSEIANYSFYWEIAVCHREIEECLLSGLFHQKYASDLMSRKIRVDNRDLYMPSFSYNDLQYLLMIGFGFDRLYSFWDRIMFLLANFEDFGKDLKTLSFESYIKEINKKINNGNSILFDENSKHLLWFLNFYKNHFVNLTKYRHRIVHYQMTPDNEGVLNSKFPNNASVFNEDLNQLKKTKLEFEGLGKVLHEQFNYCKDGFINALYLIDELQ